MKYFRIVLLIVGVYLTAVTAAPGSQILEAVAGGFFLGIYVSTGRDR